MFEDIHPHWQSEDTATVIGSAEPVSARTSSLSAPPVAAKRHTAALFGIAIVFAIGFYIFGGKDMLPTFKGQVAGNNASSVTSSKQTSGVLGNSVLIKITNTGVDPEAPVVSPGQTVTWENDSSLPHILASETLKDQGNTPLYTAAIFPGQSLTVSLAQNQIPGSYTYVSRTAGDIHGQIVLGPAGSTAGQNSSTSDILGSANDISIFGSSAGNVVPRDNSSLPSDFSNSPGQGSAQSSLDMVGMFPEATSSAASSARSSQKSSAKTATSASPLLAGFSLPSEASGTPSSDGSVTSASAQDALIPVNPYAVGADKAHPYDQFGNRTTTPLHSGAPGKPLKQPATGSDLFIVIILSLLTVAIGSSFMMKKANV